MYSRYAQFIDAESSKLFTEITQLMTDALQSSNRLHGINTLISVPSHDTKEITVPAANFAEIAKKGLSVRSRILSESANKIKTQS